MGYVNNKTRAIRNETLRTIVTVLSKEFPNCKITADLDIFPLENDYMNVNVTGVSEADAIKTISKVIPGYDLQSVDNGDFNVFVYCHNDVEDPHDLVKIFKEVDQ